MALTFYRLALTNPPTLIDFSSHAELGRPPRTPDPETERLWQGISVYDTKNRARATARKYRRLGRYLAELRIPETGSVLHERTTDSPGHYTLWGDAATLLGYVVAVEPV